jgi:hypothetical protein
MDNARALLMARASAHVMLALMALVSMATLPASTSATTMLQRNMHNRCIVSKLQSAAAQCQGKTTAAR